jgi:3-oxoacyl-[acyl-carrier protein] reductase
MRLENRVCIITGGANGIGRAVAEKFAGEGARVAIWDLVDEAGKDLKDELSGRGATVIYQHVDVTDPASVEAALKDLLSNWERVDVLVNNAGILRDAQLVRYKDGEVLSRMPVEEFDAVINVNLKGVFVCSRAVAPIMIRQGSGRILNATSVVGLYGNFGQTNYVASKAGVIGMTRVWARELGKYGITVNAVAPGFIETDMTRQMPEKVLQGMVSKTPLRRMGKPEDVANAYLFLSSEEASFITGAVLSVDGGVVVGT